MATNGQTTAMAKREKGLMEYQSGGQQVQLSPTMVRQYLVSGNKPVTEQEVILFMSLCRAYKLNPWLRDAYLIKYSEKLPAAMVVSKYAYAKRAERHPQYRGFLAGVVVLGAGGDFVYRAGALVAQGEELIGGWAEVTRGDRDHPIRSEVALHEYLGTKPIWKNQQKVGEEPTEMWTKKPGTMIRKVAVVQAWREAFPEEYAGLYSEEEMPPHDPPRERLTPDQQVAGLLGAVAAEPTAELPPAQQGEVIDAELKEEVPITPAPGSPLTAAVQAAKKKRESKKGNGERSQKLDPIKPAGPSPPL